MPPWPHDPRRSLSPPFVYYNTGEKKSVLAYFRVGEMRKGICPGYPLPFIARGGVSPGVGVKKENKGTGYFFSYSCSQPKHFFIPKKLPVPPFYTAFIAC